MINNFKIVLTLGTKGKGWRKGGALAEMLKKKKSSEARMAKD